MSGQITPEDFVFTQKPSGVSTHRPSPQHLGFVEWLSQDGPQDLYVCHRLDKETSGAMVFAKSKKAAQFLGALFEKREVDKEYLFLSHKKSDKQKWVVKKKSPRHSRG